MATKISQLPQMTTPEDVMQIPYIHQGLGGTSRSTKRMAGSLLRTTLNTTSDTFIYDGGHATSTYLDPATLTSIGGEGATIG